MMRSKKRRLAALLCAALGAVGIANAATPTRTVLPQRAQQGQLVIARTAPGSHVAIGAREARVASDGTFVFGIERDAPETITVTIRYPDEQTEQRELAITQRGYKIERVDGLPQHTVTPDPELARRIAEEQARVAAARKRDDDRNDYAHGFELPVQGRISGVYGSQRVDNGVPKAPHYGLDIAVPTGTPVKAPAAGIVSFVATDLVLTGGTVLIDHGHGLTSSFLHLSRIDIAVGARVERGEVFGAAGATGRASGPHVHWGFNWFDVRLDPALLLPGKRQVAR
ncbi:MAG: M23 family metallopeptidase [Rhodanobacteraceae bacterium]|nr:M23 family metallopeptidase [Rhodanobacteraceae bacterium]